jgi:hypothetical protein
MPVKNQRGPENFTLGLSKTGALGVSTGGGVMVGSDDIIEFIPFHFRVYMLYKQDSANRGGRMGRLYIFTGRRTIIAGTTATGTRQPQGSLLRLHRAYLSPQTGCRKGRPYIYVESTSGGRAGSVSSRPLSRSLSRCMTRFNAAIAHSIMLSSGSRVVKPCNASPGASSQRTIRKR